MTKQPDRFTKTVESWWKSLPQGKLIDVNTEMAKLLRKEHRAIVRMVQKESKTDGAGGFYDGYVCACIAILTKLNERAK